VVEQVAFIGVDDCLEQLEVERAADHRGEPQGLKRLLPQPLDAALDDLPHALWHRDASGGINAPAPGGLIKDDRAGLRQPPQDLPNEERIAVGLGGDLVVELKPVLVEFVAGNRRHDLGNLVRAQAV